MKKLLLSIVLAISPIVTLNAYAEPKFSASETAKTQLPNLKYDTVIHTLYHGKFAPFVANGDDQPLYSVMVQNGENKDVMAIFDPVVTYHNAQGETRYLVVVEKPYFDEDNKLGQSLGWGSPADVYTFKKLANNQFQLVSRSIDEKSFEGTRGFSILKDTEIRKHSTPIGKNLTGIVFDDSYMNQGTTTTWLNIVQLPEDDYIRISSIEDLGGDNSGVEEDNSDKAYNYHFTYKILNDGTAYYPIQVKMTGKKPKNKAYEAKIIKVNLTQLYTYNPVKKSYALKSQK